MPIRSTHKVDAGFSMSSMTDLVFLLLIFFVIVSTMVSPYALPVDLPKTKATTSKEPPKVALRLESGDVVKLNGSTIPPESIESALKAEMSQHGENDAIILQVAQDVPTGQMVTVLDIAKRNKWRIVLASAPTPPGQQPTPAAP
jgi:biopolymer transport protein ExbD